MSSVSRSDFEIRIGVDPYDLVTRKVFADWLEEHGFDDEAVTQRSWTKEKQDAIVWMRDFAERAYLSYEECIRAGHIAERDKYYIQQGSTEAQSLMYDDDTREEFWKNWSLISGCEVKDKNHEVFSCSC